MRRPKCVKGLKGSHSMIEVKFRVHERLILSLGKYKTRIYMRLFSI